MFCDKKNIRDRHNLDKQLLGNAGIAATRFTKIAFCELPSIKGTCFVENRENIMMSHDGRATNYFACDNLECVKYAINMMFFL